MDPFFYLREALSGATSWLTGNPPTNQSKQQQIKVPGLEYRYSNEADPATYEPTHGLAEGIPLRIHKNAFKEIEGTLRAQKDWHENVSPLNNYKGGLGDRFSLMSVAVPECLPERLEVISYANEFAFLYDDVMETLFDAKDCTKKSKDGDDLIDTFRQGVLNPETNDDTRPEKRLQAKILSEMMAIDKPRAIVAMEAWAKFVQQASQPRARSTQTLEEYIPTRVVDVGELIWFGTLTFAMGLTIPDNELKPCMKLARPGYIALALTNDLFSWEKEKAEAKAAGHESVFNAVWVIMRERDCDEEEAKKICAEEIKMYVEKAVAFTEIVRDEVHYVSRDMKVYLEAVLLTISGNLVWSMHCPRYNS